ncbi:MAG: aromatic ring-hydroxylating dioxygenase subunit alpha [Rhizobacter sp.]|nr:aromatic ring-hydroxylating dioxygenase subunit alpha [Bacteriovorax sp.]
MTEMISTKLIDRDGALVNHWYIACQSKELKDKPYESVLYDTKIVLFRDENKKAVCLLNKCLHRHSELSKGFVENGQLHCPYHGWSYDKTGTVATVPSEGNNPVKGKRCQKFFPVIEQDGVIWIFFGDVEKSKTIKPWTFPNAGDSSWSHYFMVTDFNNEVTNLVENFMDVPHTVYVHKGWFRNKSLKEAPITIETKNGGVLVTYHQKEDNIGVLIRPLLNPLNEPMEHTDHFIFPNTTRVDYSFGKNYKYIINSSCTPVSTMKSRVYTYIAYKIPVIGKFIKPFIHYYTRQVIEQDVWIMDVQGRNLIPGTNPNFQSTPADEPHLQIERLRSLGIAGDEKVYTVEKKSEATIWI